jgi:hypothetical protein
MTLTGGGSAKGGAAGPGADKPTTFEELNRILQSRGRTLSHRIQSVLQVLEENREDLRGFFSTCYQTLLWQIFNFDDGASGGGLSKMNPDGTHSLKPPGFNP